MKKSKCVFKICIVLFVIILGTFNVCNAATSYYQYVKSGINQFPDSYKWRLQELANKYPEWNFQAYYTGISWDELIKNERDESVHRNRVTNNAPNSWKHECGYVDNGWACASDSIVKYYLDPRNFLNETQIFQFVESSYNDKIQTVEAIKKSVKGTFLDNTITCKDFNNNNVTMSYSEMIVQAARESNISAFYIKSKIIQEVGNKGSGKYPGYEGYYNFYNFGAYDTGDPIANGLEYAKQKGWDSQYKAIVDGAKLIGKNYIEAGQNTAYFNKWDVVGTKILREGETQWVNKSDMFWHQYMTNIQDPTSQSYSNYKLYSNSLRSKITFIIPVYDNMPESNLMPQDVPVTGITLNQNQFIVNVDETGDAIATILPSNATEKSVEWASSNPEIVRVWNGHFRGLKEGEATIIATTIDGRYTASCKVIVRDPNKKYVEKIEIEKSQYISYIDEAVDISYKCYPENAVNTELYWTTDNTDVIRVYGNRYRGLKEGTAKLIAISDDGTVKAESKVIIRDSNKKYVEKIEIEKNQYVSYINEAEDVKFESWPSDADTDQIYWTSSNDDVLRVFGNRFRGLKEGEAEIIATTLDGTVEARAKVIIRDKNKSYVESINVEKTNYTIDLDQAIDIPFSYSPSNAVNAEFYWTSSNDDVLRVFGNRCRGLKEGAAEVIATTLDGTVEKRINVTVKDFSKIKVETINVESDEYTIKVDEAVDIPFSYSPIEASNAEFYWTSSNNEILRVFGNRFRGLKPGTAEVIVNTLDGTVEKRIKVTVKLPTVEKITLEQTEYVIDINEARDVGYTYSPTNASNAEFYWTSSNDEVLRVFGNRFRGLKEGTAEIIATTLDGTIEARAKVIVKDPNKNNINKIEIEKKQYISYINEASDINYKFWPNTADASQIYWTSSNDEIIRVWGNRFRALKEGTAEVVATTLDGKVEARAKVIVRDPNKKYVQDIKVEKTEYKIKVNEAVDIQYSYLPENAVNAEFYWTSSNNEILRVFGNRFRGLKPGTAEVIVNTLDSTIEKRIKVIIE